ncbi:hypothetical protein [Desmonostoc muscorum]|nr:hypothetical protein [Desmonostoc muscorum]
MTGIRKKAIVFAAKITSHTLRLFLHQRFGIDVLTFKQHPVA